MNKATLILVSILVLGAARISFARLGETLDQCKTRYGAPSGQNGENEFIFNRDRTEVTVHLRGDRSVREDFAPEPGNVFSEAQVAAILQENSEGSTWEAIGDSPVMVRYFRKDGRAGAEKAKEGATLTGRGAVLILKYTVSALLPQ